MLKPSNTDFLGGAGEKPHKLTEMQKEAYEQATINPVIMT